MGTRFIPAVLDVIFRLVSGGTKTISQRQVEPILDAATENALVNVCLKFCVLQHDLLPWFEAPEIGEHDKETFMLFLKSFFFSPRLFQGCNIQEGRRCIERGRANPVSVRCWVCRVEEYLHDSDHGEGLCGSILDAVPHLLAQ